MVADLNNNSGFPPVWLLDYILNYFLKHIMSFCDAQYFFFIFSIQMMLKYEIKVILRKYWKRKFSAAETMRLIHEVFEF